MMIHMTLITIILGAIQGLTEFIPVSSSGHLVIFSWLMSGEPIPLSLNIALHVGTTLAVLLYFWKDWLLIGKGSFDFVKKPSKLSDLYQNNETRLLLLLFIGSIPAGIVGILFKDMIENELHKPVIVIFPLAIVGFALWLTDLKTSQSKTISQISFKDAFIIGLAQMFALIPGVSRSGATILAARSLQLRREDAARFSFLLGTPAMLAAAVLHYKDFLSSLGDSSFILGVISSFLAGCLAIKWVLKFIVKFGFFAFAIYRLLIAAIILFLFVI